MNTQSSTQKEVKSLLEQDKEESNLHKSQFGSVTTDERSEITQKREMITGTIFSKGWMQGKGWAIGLDDKRLTNWVETEEEINQKIEKGGLTLQEISRMIYVLIEDIRNQEELKNNKNN